MTKTLTEQIVHIQNDLDVVFADVVKLEKRLEIATKALKEIAFEIGDLASDYGYHYELAQKALKEMEGLK